MSPSERCARLPASWRRVVALLVLPMVVVLLAAAIWMPISFVHDSQAEWRSEAVDTLSFAQHAPAVQAALDRQLVEMRSSPLWSRFYKAPNSASATTALHADLNALLTTVHASVQSLTPIPSEEQAAFARIGIRFAVSIRLNDLQNLLTSMTSHTRHLRVERLIVTAPQAQAPDENPPLAVTMDVYGYQLSNAVTARGEEALSAKVNGDR